MSHNLRSLTAEFVGTLLFVFLGAGSVVTTAPAGPNAGAVTSLIVALAHGVGMAIIVSATMNISGGHMNPAHPGSVGCEQDRRSAGLAVHPRPAPRGARGCGPRQGRAPPGGGQPRTGRRPPPRRRRHLPAGRLDRGAADVLPRQRGVRDGRLLRSAEDRRLWD